MDTVQGYMVEADWDGEVLRARGTNKAGRVALAGEDHDQGDVVIPRSEMAEVKFKPTKFGGTVNGNLVVTTTGGRKYQLHFRKKHEQGFRELAEALGAL